MNSIREIALDPADWVYDLTAEVEFRVGESGDIELVGYEIDVLDDNDNSVPPDEVARLKEWCRPQIDAYIANEDRWADIDADREGERDEAMHIKRKDAHEHD